jgi:hypothetical protein
MGTTSGPVAITPVQLPEAYEVSQGGVKIATFVDPQHASAYAEFISPAPKPREVFKLGPECRDTEWTRPHPYGTYRWRYDSQNHFWQYLMPGSSLWLNSKYSSPTDEDAIYPYVEVLKKEPRFVKALDDSCKNAAWVRTSTSSVYRFNGNEWEFRFNNKGDWYRAVEDLTRPYGPSSPWGYAEVLDGNNV